MPKLSALIALLALALISAHAQAESLGEGTSSPDAIAVKVYTQIFDDYLVDLPSPPPPALLDDARSVKAALLKKQDKLESNLKLSRLRVPEVLIAIVVPGGSAYLVGKTLWYSQTKQDLAQLTKDLEQVDEDLLAFQGLSNIYVIALAQGQQLVSPQ